MSLEFAPMGFIYHDGWRWVESKTLLSYDDQGNAVHTSRSKTCYQKGHCHLFFPGVDPRKCSGQMYWGSQEYTFNIVDEWGPNSNDPIQNRSVRLLGKPIWFFHIDEYWRRIFIQPWDAVDSANKLPHNQTLQYDKKNIEGYWSELIEEHESSGSNYYYDNPSDDKLYLNYSETGLKFPYYLESLRYKAALRIYMLEDETSADFYAWQHEQYSENTSYSRILSFLESNTILGPNGEPQEMGRPGIRMEWFRKWYLDNAVKYTGYVNKKDALQKYMSLHGISEKPGCKKDNDGNIFVPRDETIGHVGIKFDASKPCHSLGPFREGGELYFFNTVVNRTMPCEYWLDEEKRTRQYFLKRSGENIDTRGGQTWTFAGDNSHFVWVYDNFSEARELLGDLYELPDGSKPLKPGDEGYNPSVPQRDGPDWYQVIDGWYNYTYYNHRVPHTRYYHESFDIINGFNAKRLRTDKYEFHSDEWNQYWYGDNSRIVPSPYNETSYVNAQKENNEARLEALKQMGYYDETGWHYGIDPSQEQPSFSEPSESENAVHWERRSWTGWFEENEIVRCAKDRKWYKRTWAPNRYDSSRFDGDQPYWTRKKRQWFPNPPPWLCDDSNDGEEIESSSSSESSSGSLSEDIGGDFVKSEPWDTMGANRKHKLYWEYAYYFGLQRMYDEHGEPIRNRLPSETSEYDPETGEYITISINQDPDTGKAIAADWETRIEDWIEAFGEFQSPEDEEMCFTSWLPLLGDILMRHQDKLVYYRENGSVISDDIIDSNTGTYKSGNDWIPLPPPVYTVAYETSGYYGTSQPVTYLTFSEFCEIWRPLTEREIMSLNLDGDLPARNKTPYEVPGLEDYIGRDPEGETALQKEDRTFKTEVAAEWQKKDALLQEAAPSLIGTAFFPRLDIETRSENEARAHSKPPRPALPLSPLDEGEKIPKDGSPIDPYRNGTADPIENWKKYFSHWEEFTIPASTIAGGDKSIENPKDTPNLPFPHPRETSYSREDGARRHYPDDMYITPIIEYQKVTRINSTATDDGYCRLPGKEEDNSRIFGADGLAYKTAINPEWGDGFSASVSIPYKINGEIQSPFSDENKNVKPAGQYCHECVRPEDKMRYHIEFYDSLDKIRRFDFPNYVRIIHAFQKRHTPEGLPEDENGTIESRSLYKEDFNDYDATLEYRDDPKAADIPQGYETWGECLENYWREIDAENHYSDHPIVRNRDCLGEETIENSFVEIDEGVYMWRERTTDLLPTIDKVEYIISNGEKVPGYIDSKGNLVRGGKVVEFNNPFGTEALDGRWVEQCLGAMVKAKCLLVLEDALGHRWLQWVEDTAMQPAGEIKGRDYDG